LFFAAPYIRETMPTFQDPKITAASVALKRSQTRLTDLRRQHLQGDYLELSDVKTFVHGLALEFRGELLSLPALVRRAVQEAEIKSGWDVEDAVERAVDDWMRAYSSKPIPEPPKPLRSRGAYSTKPGPKKGSPRARKKPLEAAE
jgi:hypothetical protein